MMLIGSGGDIWGISDAFQFAYQVISGDCEITSQVNSVQNTNAWAKGGLMIRDSLAANARHAAILMTPGSGCSFQYRSVTGGSCSFSSSGGKTAPYWVRLIRQGSTFTGYMSPDGATWTQVGTAQTIAMGTDVYVGLAVTSHSSGVLCAASFKVFMRPTLTLPPALVANATNKDGAVVMYSVLGSDFIDGPISPICTPASGSTFPIGTTPVNCAATNSSNLVSAASFYVTVRRSFAAFLNGYGISDPNPLADANHSGVNNLLAYAFGLNPTAPEKSKLPTATLANGFLTITYPRWSDAADLTYIVEVSDDLQTWHSGPTATATLSATPIDSVHEQVIERDLTPTSAAPRRFIRIRIDR